LTATTDVTLELDDIQPGALYERPSPYVGTYLLLRIHDHAEGRELDRGIVFVFAGAHLRRQFEFVKTQWLNDGIFIGAPAEKDPLVGPNDGTDGFTIPERPIRRRLQNLPPFVITRGGEYCFAPGLRAMRWLAELES